MNAKSIIKIIFFGDIVGKPGRNAVKDFLTQNKEKYNFVIANVENASHGFGLTEKNYNDFIEYGIDAMTCGNHIWDKKDIFTYIDKADKLIRPINYPSQTPGLGAKIFEKDGLKIGIINVLGKVFINIADSYWDMIRNEVEQIKKITPIILIDFHAEATAEKVCFARFCSELGLSAVFGTHTHVQTADETIINNMAYITDVGFCGASDGVIGMDYQTSLARLTTALPERYEVAEGKTTQINAVEVDIDINSGHALSVKRIYCTNSNVEENQNEN